MDCNECNEKKQDCKTCTSDDLDCCPMCGKGGISVRYITVENIIEPMIIDDVSFYKDEQFYLCKSRDCQVSYYTSSGARLFIDQLKVPIWYKGKPDKYIVCYCKDITLKDIISSVNTISGNVNDITVEDVCRYLEKPVGAGKCLYHNPTGKSCRPLFQNAIEYAKTQFK
ncbi:hypothetical protein [Haloplasma contractile]|uniref:BFD domain protein n=1 Tax=Haloplasma contractile SSD-17B TaxID=1033810 RepID=F7PWL9_9MOLU|nr:hypothetical protein [Haloplasma contractile]ERJ12610.1 BFD domain protein [Haloplasma contractile SSD-17B]